jgi:hypothetical protein
VHGRQCPAYTIGNSSSSISPRCQGHDRAGEYELYGPDRLSSPRSCCSADKQGLRPFILVRPLASLGKDASRLGQFLLAFLVFLFSPMANDRLKA